MYGIVYLSCCHDVLVFLHDMAWYFLLLQWQLCLLQVGLTDSQCLKDLCNSYDELEAYETYWSDHIVQPAQKNLQEEVCQ